jgi:CRISPR system Cascade subunit CasE
LLNLQATAARRDIIDPYQMHRTLQRAVAADRVTAGLLCRLELGATEAIVLAQSRQPLDWSRLPEGYLKADAPRPNPAVRCWTPQFGRGQVLCFRLRANPTFKRGRRHLGWLRAEEQRAWLERRGECSGFGVLQAWPVSEGFVSMPRPGLRKRTMTCYSVLFDGLLRVSDPARLATAVATGLGSGKAFGFGLLSLASAGGPGDLPSATE